MSVAMAGRLFLVVSGLLLAGTAAGAQGFGGGQGVGPGFGNRRPPMERAFGAAGGNKGWWNNPRIAERLKLTDDQRKAMDAILLQHREKLIDLQANLQKAELTMQPLMGADTPNEGAITAQIDKVVQARGDLERANARFLLAIREKLTPDQWKQLQAARDNGGMREEQRERWGRDGQRPGMQGPGGQFHRQPPPPPPPPDSPQQAPIPGTTAPGTGSGPGEMQ